MLSYITSNATQLQRIIDIVNSGKHPDMIIEYNTTALCKACQVYQGGYPTGLSEKWLNFIEFLLKNGANPNYKCSNSTPFQDAVERISHGDPNLKYNVLNVLLKYGGNVNYSPNVLFNIVSSVDLNINYVILFLQYNVITTNKSGTRNGYTPLDWVNMELNSNPNHSKYLDIKYLLENGIGNYSSMITLRQLQEDRLKEKEDERLRLEKERARLEFIERQKNDIVNRQRLLQMEIDNLQKEFNSL